MLYYLFTPTSALADIIYDYWYAPVVAHVNSRQQFNTPLMECMVFNFNNLKEYYHYAGKTNIITKKAYIFGQTESTTVISGIPENDGYILGVRFKPLGLSKLTGINMTHITGKLIDAEDLWGNRLNHLCDAMASSKSIKESIGVLEKFLLKQRRTILTPERTITVVSAISLMNSHRGNITSTQLQYLTNTGRKTLERAFMDYHGMTPKTYNKIIRYNTARLMIDKNPGTSLTRLCHYLGYYDQSHFIKDFRRFSEQSPSQYIKTIEDERKKRTIPID